MTPDPFVDSASNLQSYNRYSYVNNNPLAYTDPSGYFKLKSLFKAAAVVAAAYFTYGAVSSAMISSATSGFLAGGGLSTAFVTIGGEAAVFSGLGGALAGAAGGFAAGLVGGGTLESGLHGAIGGALFGAAGTVGGPTDFSRYAAHAGAGCISGQVNGGGCGRGAVSAVAGKLGTNLTDGNFVATVVASGTVSTIGGGKFGNGALTGAFGYMFNYCTENSSRCYVQKFLNGARIIGGIVQTVGGGAMCVFSAGLACAAGAPIAAVGASQVMEGVTYFRDAGVEEGFNPTRVTLQKTAGDSIGTHLYTAAEVGTALGVNAAPVVVSKWHLFHPDLKPKIETLSSGAAAFQVMTTSGKLLSDPYYTDQLK